jgi:hypothetical protein
LKERFYRFGIIMAAKEGSEKKDFLKVIKRFVCEKEEE